MRLKKLFFLLFLGFSVSLVTLGSPVQAGCPGGYFNCGGNLCCPNPRRP